jgi:DNA repair exonuclease SbcCD nuclease subunit
MTKRKTSDTFRILHTADWHLGAANQPDVYLYQSLRLLLDIARAKQCDLVLVAGDTINSAKPDYNTINYLIGILLEHNDLQFVFVPGNHDFQSQSHTIHNLNTLKVLESVIPHVHVLDPTKFAHADVLTCPHLVGFITPQSLTQETSFGDVSNLVGSDCIIGVWHGTVPGMSFDGTLPQDMGIVNDFIDTYNLDYLALGHIHQQIKVSDKCWYPGSLYPKTYKCTDGFLIVDISHGGTEIVHQGHLAGPKRISVSLDLEPEDDADSIIKYINKSEEVPHGSLLKIKFHVPAAKWAAINKQKLVNKLSENFLEVKLKNEPDLKVAQRDGLQDFVELKSPEQELDFVIQQLELDEDMDIQQVKKLCLRYLGDTR